MRKLFHFILPCLIFLFSLEISAQDEKRVVQFSGIVAGGDSLYGVPDVAVYVPLTGRGVLTNHVGYFSLPTLAGDTIRIKGMGFKEKKFVIPDSSDHITVFVRMDFDTITLPEIVLWPYPTFESFKQAFLAIEDRNEDELASKNLDEKVLKRMLYNTEATANMNHRYFSNDYASRKSNPNSVPTFSIFSPFAWAKFIKDIKSGELRNKKWEDTDKYYDEEKNNR